MQRKSFKRRFSRKNKSRNRTQRQKGKFNKKKIFRGGFLSDLSYLMNEGTAFFSVDPNPPQGNPSNPVPPFPYFQTNKI